MGRFRQSTIDRWAATGRWLIHGKEGETFEDYLPEAMWKREQSEKTKPVKPSKKKRKT